MVEGLGFGSVDEALEDDGAIADAVEGSGGDGEVVADEVELGELGLAGEVELGWVSDADFVAVDGEEFGLFFGGFSLHTGRLHLFGWSGLVGFRG